MIKKSLNFVFKCNFNPPPSTLHDIIYDVPLNLVNCYDWAVPGCFLGLPFNLNLVNYSCGVYLIKPEVFTVWQFVSEWQNHKLIFGFRPNLICYFKTILKTVLYSLVTVRKILMTAYWKASSFKCWKLLTFITIRRSSNLAYIVFHQHNYLIY